jgi:hypothetical protein
MIVTATRDTEDNTYRKRKCTKCFFKITTVEIYSIDSYLAGNGETYDVALPTFPHTDTSQRSAGKV